MPKYLICGIDEVGRGALAGPILAVATLFKINYKDSIFTKESPIDGVNDSKKLSSHGLRRKVFHKILRHTTLIDFGIGEVSERIIDQEGIDWANKMAFRRAIDDLCDKPDYILVDGINIVPGVDPRIQILTPKGDGIYWPVGAASILAKVIRDEFMIELGKDYPLYQWARNAGYGTKAHNQVLKNLGPTPHHRMGFVKDILNDKNE